ncbi:MAG: putative protease [Candidatus Rifleibacterium amylolyticum]|nr:MAG: putative protease [Candidatus Rifleibacterium amylolyticum]
MAYRKGIELNKPGKSIELLAPAGTTACLKAACLAGADAIYLAGQRFGARAFAGNFDEKSLRWARRVTEALGKKLYITLNTIVFEHEFKLLEEALDFYEVLQPDSLIIQDLGVAALIKRRKSRIPLHLSTQGAWFGQGGRSELADLNISRVILPRELSHAEILSLREAYPDLELEVFVHGAMCYSISGRCFWSIALGSRSGNRGTCAQPCRREYQVNGRPEQTTCCFSPKDLRLIEQVTQLQKCGVVSLKIEGRMKGPEYVYQTVKSYREALDQTTTAKPAALDEVFSRASGPGFFKGPADPSEWHTGSNVGREGALAATATGKSNEGLVELKLVQELAPGDGVFWFIRGEKQGSRITWIKTDRKRPGYAMVRGLPTSLKTGTEIRRSSQGSSPEWESQWNRDWERRPIDLFWSGHDGTPLAVEAVINDHPLRLETDEPLQLAMNKGLEDGPLQEKFSVLGDQFKAGRQVTARLDRGLHISGSALKRLKRSLVEYICKLEQLPPPKEKTSIAGMLIAAGENRQNDYTSHFSAEQQPQIRLRVWNQSFPFLRDIHPDCWILPWQGDQARADKVIHSKIAWWLAPVLTRQHFDKLLEQLKSLESGEFLCFGWEAFDLARLLPNLKFSLDWCFNTCNLAAIDYIRGRGVEPVLSREWKDEHIPENLTAFRSGCAWNPLVSFSRFTSDLPPGKVVQNSHNDKFFQLPVGNGVTATFLEDIPASLTRHGNASLQIDIAISPQENPVQVAKDLNRMLAAFKAA